MSKKECSLPLEWFPFNSGEVRYDLNQINFSLSREILYYVAEAFIS